MGTWFDTFTVNDYTIVLSAIDRVLLRLRTKSPRSCCSVLRCARFAHTEFARGARAAPRTTPLLVARVARLGDARLVATAAGRRALFSALTQSQIDFFFFFSARVWDMCQVR